MKCCKTSAFTLAGIFLSNQQNSLVSGQRRTEANIEANGNARSQWQDAISRAQSALGNRSSSFNVYQYSLTETIDGVEQPTRFVTVENDALISVVPEFEFRDEVIDVEQYSTIPGLFDRFDDMIEDSSFLDLNVTYDLWYLGNPSFWEYRLDNQTSNNQTVKYSARIDFITHYLILRRDWEQTRQRWNAISLTDYWYVAQAFCFCDPDYVKPKAIWVRNGTVHQVIDTETGQLAKGEYLSLDDMFQNIEDAISAQYWKINVTYNMRYGYISSLSTTFADGIADGTFSAAVTQFNASGGAPPFFPTQEEDPSFLKHRKDLQEARNLWNSLNTDQYYFTFQRDCPDCKPEFLEPYVVHVEQNQIVNVTNRATQVPAKFSVSRDMTTIDGLFQQINEALNAPTPDRVADFVQITYDNLTGAPTTVYLDYFAEQVNEEVSYAVSEIRMPTQQQAQLDTSAQIIQQANWSNYTYLYAQSCNGICSSGPFLVTVVNDSIVSVEEQTVLTRPGEIDLSQTTSNPTSRNGTVSTSTVPSLQDLQTTIQEALDQDAFLVQVEYDPQFGNPIDIFIDYDPFVADEEFLASTRMVTVDGMDAELIREPANSQEEDEEETSSIPSDVPSLTPSMVPTLVPTPMKSMKPSETPSGVSSGRLLETILVGGLVLFHALSHIVFA